MRAATYKGSEPRLFYPLELLNLFEEGHKEGNAEFLLPIRQFARSFAGLQARSYVRRLRDNELLRRVMKREETYDITTFPLTRSKPSSYIIVSVETLNVAIRNHELKGKIRL